MAISLLEATVMWNAKQSQAPRARAYADFLAHTINSSPSKRNIRAQDRHLMGSRISLFIPNSLALTNCPPWERFFLSSESQAKICSRNFIRDTLGSRFD